MARSNSREDVQDRILNQMERASRNSQDSRRPEELSLQEQLKREAAWNSLSPEEKLKRLNYTDWQRKIKDFCSEKRITITDRCWRYITTRLKPEFEKFHQEGTPLNEVTDWMKKKDLDLLNGF